MKKILIIGASGHAKVVIDIIERQNTYQIFGLIDSFKDIGTQLLGYNILGTEDDIPNLIEKHDIYGGLIAVGDNWKRSQLVHKIENLTSNFKFIVAIHPSAIIGKQVDIEEGSVIVAGVVINCDTQIGKHCIVNTKASVGHDCTIKAFSSIAPGVTLGGHVMIENHTAISLGANLIGKIHIGEHTVIGAGALVLNDIESYKIAYGVPAKPIKNREAGDVYL
ncbi:acetyltransferase [Yeosuana marina]|uniref:acetyltransferase n=1 Tax=Yeosuana marina TaxID=1565536 RepID=UPI0014214636|nr:acetyltransferase [Yeosuana marina]